MVAGALEVVGEPLDTWLVRDRGVWKRSRAPRFGRVFAGLAVNQVQPLGLCVVGLEVVVGDRPRRRDAAVMSHFSEVALAQPEQDRAVELGVPADEVLLMGLVRIPVLVVPELVVEV